MRLVYFGTSEFAVPALKLLADDIVLVVTQPDRPAGRGRKMRASPVKQAAQALGLVIESPESAKDPAFIARVQLTSSDALVVASYGQILKESLLSAAVRGGINLHASILPKYRGAAPVQRAVLAGEQETGVTLMQMDKGMDTGDIIAIERTRIDPDESAGELEARLAVIGANMTKHWLPLIVAGGYERTPQNNSEATLAPKMTRDDGELRFDTDAVAAYNRFRAATPRPGAWMDTRFGPVRTHSARLAADLIGHPGEVIAVDDSGLVVAFIAGSLRLIEVQPGGKSRMSALDFANGHRIEPGSTLAAK